ncbi:hypothetical protein BH09ACT8_BH09ACT8_28530 [soil metagenome]
MNTVNGPVTIDAPRDRNGSFEPVIVPKKTRRLNNINSIVLSPYSRGMTTHDLEAHLGEVYGAKVSCELISNMTEVVADEIKAWQAAPRGNSHSTGDYLPRTLWNSPRRPFERRKRAHSPGGHNAHSLPIRWCSWAERSCVQTHRAGTDANLTGTQREHV